MECLIDSKNLYIDCIPDEPSCWQMNRFLPENRYFMRIGRSKSILAVIRSFVGTSWTFFSAVDGSQCWDKSPRESIIENGPIKSSPGTYSYYTARAGKWGRPYSRADLAISSSISVSFPVIYRANFVALSRLIGLWLFFDREFGGSSESMSVVHPPLIVDPNSFSSLSFSLPPRLFWFLPFPNSFPRSLSLRDRCVLVWTSVKSDAR